MKHKIYSVYDSKSEIYNLPFLQRTKGEAIRTFTELANDEKTSIGKNPEDYTLTELGEFDDNTAEYHVSTPTQIGLALEFKTKDQ